MIVSGLVLFLFGTAVYAGPFIAPKPTDIIISKNRNHPADRVVEYYPSSDKTSPFISNFIQKGTNVFFKPQFVMSAAQMPPQIQTLIAEIEKDDCKTTYPMGPVPVLPVVEEPLRIIEKEIFASPEIKEVIEINPMSIHHHVALPETPLLVQEPCEVEQVLVPETPELPVYISEMPAPRIPLVVEVEETKAPLVIPPAPVLPPMEMPKIPMMIEEVPLVAPLPEIPMIIEEPCVQTEVIHEVELEPVIIPQAPVLPPYTPAELPVVLVEEKVIETEPVHPTILSEPIEIIEPVQPMTIPEAPVLPPLSMKIPAPVIVEEIVQPVPSAPLLPSFEIPKMSVFVEESKILPCAPGEELHFTSEPVILPSAPVLPSYVPEVTISQPTPVVIEETPIVIPRAPELPPFTMPQLPVEVVVEENVMTNVIPPVSWDTVEIVEKHSQPITPEAPLLPPMGPLELPVPVMIEVEKEVVLPAAPLLPPFEMPTVPIIVPEPCDTVEVIEEHIKPMAIPEAPLLPPLAPIVIPASVMIEEPVSFEVQKEIVTPVVIPTAPVLPSLVMPELPKVALEPCETVEIIEEYVQPMVIPEAPLLPPLAPLPIPTSVIVEEPAIVEMEKEVLKPIVLPPAPELPHLEIPKMPIMFERPAEIILAPCPPEQEIIVEKRPLMPMPYAYSDFSLSKPIIVATAPMSSEFYVPNHNGERIMMEKNSLLSFPATKDYVVEYLPKMEMIHKEPVPYHYATLSNTIL